MQKAAPMNTDTSVRSQLLLPLACTLVLGLATLNAMQVGSIQDDAWYLVTADGLAQGSGFVRLWTPNLMAETSLPPGFPALLSPLRWLFPGSFVPAQLLSLAAMLGVVAMAGLYYRRHLDARLAVLASLFLAVNVGVIQHSTVVMTEAAYTFCVMLIMTLVWHSREHGGEQATTMIAVALLAVVAYFIRSWGLALGASLIASHALRGRRLGAVAASLPFVAGYALWAMRNEASGGIGGSYGIAPSTVVTFIRRFNDAFSSKLTTHWLHDLPQWFFTPRTVYTLDSHELGWLALLVGAVVLALLVIGFVAQARHETSLVELFVLAHAALVSIAPLNARYWIPVLPFLVLYFIVGLRIVLAAAQRWLTARQSSALVVLVLVALVGLHVVRDVQDVFDPPRLRVPDVAIGALWIAANTPANAVILANTPRVSYLYARRTIWAFPDGRGEIFEAYPDLPLVGKSERLLAAIEQTEARYILVEPSLGQHPPFKWSDYVRQVVVATIEAEPQRFRLLFADGTGMTRAYFVEH
jgi:hypothetical protein